MPNLEEEEIYDQMDLQEEDEDEDEDDQDQFEDEDEDEEETEDEIEAEEDETLVRSSRVPQNDASTSAQAFISVREDNAVEEREDKRRKTEKGEASSSTNRGESKESSSGGDWNRTEIDGLFCPICMEAWTSDGDHHVCCLPCGHIYGMSCIKRWFRECRSSGKCPQCNMKCKLKDVRKLYASRIVVVDEESQKKIRSLEAKCASLEKKGADWCQKEAEWQKREADLQLQVHQLTEGQMTELQSQPAPDGADPLTADEICDRVIETRSGYIRVLEHGQRPTSSSTSGHASQAQVEARQRAEDVDRRVEELAQRVEAHDGVIATHQVEIVALQTEMSNMSSRVGQMETFIQTLMSRLPTYAYPPPEW